MGRARRGSQAVASRSATALTAVFGAHRGRLHDDKIEARTPTPLAEEAAERLRIQLRAGNIKEAFALLVEHRKLITERPLLNALANDLVAAVLEGYELARDRAYRGFVNMTGLRCYWADQLIAVERLDEDGDWQTIHVWAEGEHVGERHVSADNLRRIEVACGQVLDIEDVSRLVPRGAWREPTFDNTGSPWEYVRCRDCENTQPQASDCYESPGSIPVLGPSDLESFRVLAQTRLRADLDSRLASRSAALGGFLIHADKVQQNALTDVVAARLAADGDVALARINGYASGFPVLPTEEQWRTLLEPLRPHGRNAKRYGAQPLEGDLLNEFNGNAITSQFKSQIRRLLLSIQEN